MPPSAAALAAAALGVPALLAVAGLDYVNTRNVLIAWVPALLVVAVGLAAGRRAGTAGLAVLCAVGVAATVVVARDSTYQKADWRSASRALGPVREPRAVVVPPVAGPVGLGIYRDGLAPLTGSAPVREVDVLTPRNRRLGGDGAARPPDPQAPTAEFELVERRYTDDFTLLRFRAPRPVPVDAQSAARAATGVFGGAAVYLERPGVRAASPVER